LSFVIINDHIRFTVSLCSSEHVFVMRITEYTQTRNFTVKRERQMSPGRSSGRLEDDKETYLKYIIWRDDVKSTGLRQMFAELSSVYFILLSLA
jgi:hypothetical protein